MSKEAFTTQALHVSERGRKTEFSELNAVLANLTEGVIIFDPEGHLLAVNSAALEMHGAEHVEDFYADPQDYLSSLDVFSLEGKKLSPEEWPLSRVLRGERFSSQEVQIHHRAAGKTWIGSYGGSPILNETGEMSLAVLTIRNITDEKKTKKLLEATEQRAQHLIKASEELASSLDYKETLQQVANLMVTRFADWCIVTIGETPGELRQVAVAHADPDKVQWAEEISQKYPPDPDAEQGTPYVVRTGKTAFYPSVTDEQLEAAARDEEHLRLLQEVGFSSVIIVPLVARGHTLGALSFIYTDPEAAFSEADVQFAKELARRAALAVDNARLYKEAVESREEAEAANKAKSTFLANMSHEIRTPLTTVTGFLPLLEEGSPEDRKKYLELIQGGAERLKAMLESIMTLSQLEAGKATGLNLRKIDLTEEVEEVVQLLETRAKLKGLRLVFSKELGEPPAIARLDLGALTSILNNLISNAIKFTDEGRVTVTAGADQQRAFVRVEDTGQGISEAFLEDLFVPFEQESSGVSRTHEGSGLGLSIAKRLTEAMEGRIEVETRKGAGTTFTLWFPLAEVEEKKQGQEAISPDEAALSARKARMLVVEDNPDIQMLLSSLFENKYDLETAETAEDALQKAGASSYDLVLLDIHLRGSGSGIEVLKALRKEKAYERVPMVAMTAYGLPGDRERFLEAGFDAYLGKPFSPDEVGELTKRLLNVN